MHDATKYWHGLKHGNEHFPAFWSISPRAIKSIYLLWRQHKPSSVASRGPMRRHLHVFEREREKWSRWMQTSHSNTDIKAALALHYTSILLY